MKKHNWDLRILLLFTILTLCACGMQSQSYTTAGERAAGDKATTGSVAAQDKAMLKFEELDFADSQKLQYAEQFTVESGGDYNLVTIVDNGRFLLVPDGEPVPDGLPKDVTVLRRPLDRVYLVSSSAMDLIQAVGALPDVRLSGTRQENWYIEEAADAMAQGEILYAGKYNAPDYELILSEGCDLAIENTMIHHKPEVKEKLEELGIPVLVERSSYEKHPLGRLEWIKLYGVLFGKEEEAKRCYEEQLERIQPILEQKPTGVRVAFFSVASNGSVTVHKPEDYIAQMIELAGGEYILKASRETKESALSTMKMQMEDFYAAAKEADVLIYNSTIEGELADIDDLLAKNILFADFKAVKESYVFCTERNCFQESMGIGELMEDLNHAVKEAGGALSTAEQVTENYTYLRKLGNRR